MPDVAEHHCADASVAEALHGERGLRVLAVGHGGDDARAGLEAAHLVQHAEGRDFFEPAFLVGFGGAQACPRLEPAFTGQVEAQVAGCRFVVGLRLVEINGQHVADGCAVVFPFLKRFRAAEHEEAAAAFGHEFLEQHQLVGGKKLGFEIVEDDGVVAVEIFGKFGEAAAELVLVLGVQADQHRLIVAFGLFLGLIAETTEERVAGFAGASAKLELRLASRDAQQGDELDLIVFQHGALEEFVFPIRTARDVEDAVRPASAIDHDDAAVVRERGFGGGGDVGRVLGRFLGRDLEAVEGKPALVRLELETKVHRTAVARHALALLGHGLVGGNYCGRWCRRCGGHGVRLRGGAGAAGVVRRDRRGWRGGDVRGTGEMADLDELSDDCFAWITGRADFGLHGHGRVFKRRLTHGDALQGDVLHGVIGAHHDGINRRKSGEVGQSVAKVRGVAIGEEQDAREWLAFVAVGEIAQGGNHRRDASIEGEFREVARGLESGVEEIAAELEVLIERGLPELFVAGEHGLENFTARTARAAILDLHALAVVGEHGEVIRAGPGTFPAPERFQQAEREGEDADELEEKTEGTKAAAAGRIPIGPRQQQEDDGGEDGSRD